MEKDAKAGITTIKARADSIINVRKTFVLKPPIKVTRAMLDMIGRTGIFSVFSVITPRYLSAVLSAQAGRKTV